MDVETVWQSSSFLPSEISTYTVVSTNWPDVSAVEMNMSLRFDMILWEVSISPVSYSPVQFGSCACFQNPRDGAHSRGVTLQQWCDSPSKAKKHTYISRFLIKCLRFVCAVLKWRSHPSISFFFSKNWSHLVSDSFFSSPVCFRFKLDIIDLRM